MFNQAHKSIVALCDHFAAEREHVMAAGYKEAEARDQFITPFFEALGWDVRNTAHRSVYEKDVVIESRQNISGTAKSADYAFRRPGTHLTSFFVEAKKPSVDIRGHAECYQAVLYGWNASTLFVVLTDFEQLLILDARSEPDRANAARHVLKAHGSYTYRDYRDPDKFAELWGLLARENVAAGSLDKAAAALPRLSGRIKKDDLFARGTGPVDETFLAQMELWREKLAKSLKRANHHLDGERLTSLTQRILDRLVFLRFLEDRGVERDVTFKSIGQSGSAWSDFLKVSRRLDARYNGIIYKKDTHGCEDPDLEVDDSTFAAIAEKFAPENSSYLFDKISITILGSIYERFLGNVIVARDRTAIVEPKPEVRKAGGVYYTPDYIVRYIVEQTVGRCIANKSPKEIGKLRFADIACGSGSFLVEVFASLIRYHLAWYLADGAAKWEKRGILRTREIDGDYVLSLAEKRRILLAIVYGVDLDPQAVAVTQLSLYLRLMEDESFPSTQLLFDEEHRALLPDLRDNIICGNSIIETDIADLFGLSPREEEEIRPLDLNWQFPTVFPRGKGGFDAIVGNPPYGAQLDTNSKEYFGRKYSAQSYQAESYLLFLERAITTLVKDEGRVGMIIPNPWLTNILQTKMRKLITSECRIDEIAHFQFAVFPKVTVDTEIVVLQRGNSKGWKPKATLVPSLQDFLTEERPNVIQLTHDQDAWRESDGAPINIFLSAPQRRLASKIKAAGVPLSSLCFVNVGIKPYQTGKGSPPQTPQDVASRPFDADHRVTNQHRVCLRGADINRFIVAPTAIRYLKFGPWLAEPRPAANFDAPEKIFMRQTGDSLIAALDTELRLCMNNMHIIVPSDDAVSCRFMLGLLNSELLNWYYQTLNPEAGEALAEVKRTNVAALPMLPKTNVELERLVTRMLSARSSEVSESGKHEHWQRECEKLDRQINDFVYELYGLTEEEIRLVEE